MRTGPAGKASPDSLCDLTECVIRMLGPPPLAFAHRRQADSGHRDCVFPCPGEPRSWPHWAHAPVWETRTDEAPSIPGRWLGGWGTAGGWGPVTSCRKRLKARRTNHGCWGSLLPAPTRPGPHQPGPLLELPGGRGFPDEQASTSFTITQVLQTTVTNDEHRALHRFLRGFWSEARSRVCRKWNTHLVYSLGITLSLFQNLWSGCAYLHLTKYFLVSGPCESRFFTLDMKYLKQ